MLDPKCIYIKNIFAKCTRPACLLSFASLFKHKFHRPVFFEESAAVVKSHIQLVVKAAKRKKEDRGGKTGLFPLIGIVSTEV